MKQGDADGGRGQVSKYLVEHAVILGPRMRNQTALRGSHTIPDYFQQPGG